MKTLSDKLKINWSSDEINRLRKLRRHMLGLSLLMAVLLSIGSTVGFAQVDTGSIQGQVEDGSHAVIPNASVVLKSENTGVAQSTKSDAQGEFTFSPVRIGVYTLTVTASGFQKSVSQHIQLEVQQQLRVPVVLQPGSNEQTVEVTADDIPLLQTQNASVGQTVDAAQINSLPLNGRNYYFLAQTAAGVTTAQNGSRGEDQNGRFVANGVRATQNDYLLDEIDNNSAIISVQNGKDYVIQTPVDALADFKIQTNDYNAEFGRAAGAVLNATVKSGTNSFHGDVWEFLRNDVLDANDYFQNQAGLKRPPFRRNQYGFTLGGPVWLSQTRQASVGSLPLWILRMIRDRYSLL